MGVDSKTSSIPPLPAPTETESTTSPTEVNTDVSKIVDDRSSYSLPDDGTPVTIRTRSHHRPNRSQTSLLIEYFEGGNAGSSSTGGERKPSVRVRLTPSKHRKSDHIQITETKTASTRKASLSRRSAGHSARRSDVDAEALGSAVSGLGEAEETKSMSSYASATEESNVSRNIEVEINPSSSYQQQRRPRRPASPLIPTADSSKVSYQPGNQSEISAIPTDSFLDGVNSSNTHEIIDGSSEVPATATKPPALKRSRSPSYGKDAMAAAAGAAAAAVATEKLRSKSRSGGSDRIVVPKSKDRDKSERRHKSSRGRTSSDEKERAKSPRRRSSRSHHDISVLSGADSSVVSSAMSPSHRSYAQESVRSGASKSSINNPKLLETVEDAIRRLILPELDALKREQSRKDKDRRGSVTSSGTSVSREEYVNDRRRSGGSDRHASASARDSAARIRESRDREARNEVDESSSQSFHQESAEEHTRGVEDTPQRSNDKLKTAAAAATAGAGLGAMAAVLSSPHVAASPEVEQKSPMSAREQRRRRRAEARSRGSDRYLDEEELQQHSDYLQPVPPMPLMSEINPSEVTRTSILSAESDRPHSATEELAPAHEITRDAQSVRSDSSTPTRSQSQPTLQALGAQHANVSHGDLKALPRKGPVQYAEEPGFETDEYGHQVPIQQHREEYDEEEYDDMGHGAADPAEYSQHSAYDYYGNQIVPAPLKYVPYQPERRGLSPIPSVSGYTEGGSEMQQNRDSKVTATSRSSVESFPQQERDHRSPGSVPSNMRSREFDNDDRSFRSSAADERTAPYTEGSELDPVPAGQAMRDVGANPDIVSTPVAVESHVASLVDGSMLDDSVLTGESGYAGRDMQHAHRDSMDTLEEERSRGHASPSKRSAASSRREMVEEHREEHEAEAARASPATTRTNPSEFAGEYDLDNYGRKVQGSSSYRRSPTASEAAITAGAVGLAIKAARDRSKQPSAEPVLEEQWNPEGVARNRSFKERAMDGRRLVDTPSVDGYEQPKMSASGLPDLSNPLPEIGYGYDHEDLDTNPSIIEGQLDGNRHMEEAHDDQEDHWGSGDRTPTQQRHIADHYDDHHDGNMLGAAGTAAAGAAALATAAAMASSHNRQPSQDQEENWQRTSEDRKRDTLITNPYEYEGENPVVNLPVDNDDLLKTKFPGVGYGDGFVAPRSPLPNQKIDEGYISQGPNKTPDLQGKGKGVDYAEQPSYGGGQGDPFYNAAQAKHLSGMSQGMGSPLYDAATGVGIDRIENKDIVALMQHLMVRDAQRSARDTEILVTLVRAAAEMRTSFESMKNMLAMQEKGLHGAFARRLADTENAIITEVQDNTEKTVRTHVSGPRPYPGSGSRSIKTGGSLGDMDDLPTKRQNFFRRALKSLNAKGNNDLSRIEDMLNQLLAEVDVLKAQTAEGPKNGGSPPRQSFDDNMEPDVQYEQDRGYEPEGNAGTSTGSHASQSGALSINSRGPSTKQLGYERKFSDHRISTVPEANEDELDHDDFDNANPRYSSGRISNQNLEVNSPGQEGRRGSSVPLGTPPPQNQTTQQASLSNENTPRTDKGKKHKSNGSSSWFPKISRWSETTTSSVGRVFRSSKDSKKDHDLGEFHSSASRSGSDLVNYDDYQRTDPEGEDKLHSGFSEPDLLHRDLMGYPPPMHPMPPHPSTYMTPEDPKYQAHRDSLNLQHPQPRSGQPFKAALESKAEDFAPMSPKSADWAGSATSLDRFTGQNTNRYSDESAAQSASQAQQQQQYWTSSPGGGNQPLSAGPPRPPKEPLEEGRTPQKSSRVNKLQKNSPLPYHSVESGYGTATHGAPTSYAGSPTRLENRNLSGALGTAPTRRPSGPRAMTPKSEKSMRSYSEEGDKRDEQRRKRDTFGTVASQESETF